LFHISLHWPTMVKAGKIRKRNQRDDPCQHKEYFPEYAFGPCHLDCGPYALAEAPVRMHLASPSDMRFGS
jgi:hypothetical protein